jgi:hypothetical protein
VLRCRSRVFGHVHVVLSRVSDLSGQIWYIREWWLLLLLRRSETTMATRAPGISANKVRGSPLVWGGALLCSLLSVCRGGEGMKRRSSGAAEEGGGRGSSALPHQRNGRRPRKEGVARLPRWKAADAPLDASPQFHKRMHGHLDVCLKKKVFLPLAGRGGEEWKGCCFSSSASVRWWIGFWLQLRASWILLHAYLLCPPPPTRGRSGEFDGGSFCIAGVGKESSAASSAK